MISILNFYFSDFLLNSNFETNKFKDFLGKLDPLDLVEKKSSILLETSGENSAAIIQQVWNSSSLRSSKANFDIKIETQKKKKSSAGIYAVIQKMKLRKNARTQKCIDYVKFRFGNRKYSDEICDPIGPDMQQVMTLEDIAGEFKMYVHIETVLPLAYKDTLQLMVIFTAYTDCRQSNYGSGDTDENDDDSSSDDDDSSMSSASSKERQIRCNSKNKFNSCISGIFEHDHIVNCPEPNCEDESGCPAPELVTEFAGKPSTSNIALSAITSLIFTMVAVGSCMWICFKYRECMSVCSADQRHRRNHHRSTTTPGLQMETASVDRAPPYPVVTTPTSEKDLPPSYDSLFGDTSSSNQQQSQMGSSS